MNDDIRAESIPAGEADVIGVNCIALAGVDPNDVGLSMRGPYVVMPVFVEGARRCPDPRCPEQVHPANLLMLFTMDDAAALVAVLEQEAKRRGIGVAFTGALDRQRSAVAAAVPYMTGGTGT